MEQIELIKTDFKKCRKLLIAIGDETRQNIVTVLMGAGCTGMRVGEITKQTHLSRPAVSHHIRVLLDCGLVSVTKQGTMNFYSLNTSDELLNLFSLVNHIAKFKEAADTGQLTGVW
jgi:ArsR family transcriptional regulator